MIEFSTISNISIIFGQQIFEIIEMTELGPMSVIQFI